MGTRGRRRRELLDDLKEKIGYWQLKEETLYRTLWRTRFGRGYGPVVRQTTEWWMMQVILSFCSRYMERLTQCGTQTSTLRSLADTLVTWWPHVPSYIRLIHTHQQGFRTVHLHNMCPKKTHNLSAWMLSAVSHRGSSLAKNLTKITDTP
jgi:hypothetical protein